jgi:phosphoribosyl-ATP pyrophosphohydrolase
MTPKKFIKTSVTRDMPDLDYSPVLRRLADNAGLLRLIHASIGMSGEAGEIVDALKKVMMYGSRLDIENLKEECGDVLWYMAIMLDALGSSFEEVMQMNADKLAKRYPNGFNEKDAIARADKK